MKDVTVYSKPNCGKCKMLKRWLDIKGLEYSEVDITQNEESYGKIVSAGRTSLPVLEINDEFVDFEEYNEILEMIK